MPQEGEQVLVIGFLSTELGGKRKEKSVGLVNWESAVLLKKAIALTTATMN